MCGIRVSGNSQVHSFLETGMVKSSGETGSTRDLRMVGDTQVTQLWVQEICPGKLTFPSRLVCFGMPHLET